MASQVERQYACGGDGLVRHSCCGHVPAIETLVQPQGNNVPLRQSALSNHRWITGKSTLEWREGARVVESPKLERGTAIATFVKGRYPRLEAGHGNHAALFLWHVSDGFYVMDQFVTGNRKEPVIGRRYLRKLGKNPDGTYINPGNNADAFSVIEK